MPIEILMPALSPTMLEGNLAQWNKKEGDKIEPGEVIAEVETDKAVMEVESADAGILGKIVVVSGSENIKVNQVIALLLEDGEDLSVLEDYVLSTTNEDQKSSELAETVESEGSSPATASKGGATPGVVMSAPSFESQFDLSNMVDKLVEKKISLQDASGNRVFISPLARKLAEVSKVQVAKVKGTGPNERITVEDVERYIKNNALDSEVVRNSQEYIAVKNSNMRKVIAKRLLESKQFVPHFYLSIDTNITKLLDVRKQLNDDAGLDEKGKPNYKISVNDFVVRACAKSLSDVPAVNSSWAGDGVVFYNNIDISIAVAIEDGLITPIVKNADQKSIFMTSNEVKFLAKRARDGALQPEEFQGGGFSISNLGMYGIKSFNAIVNPPQSSILSVGSGEKKPIINAKGEICVADIMNLSLSADHRVVDGAVGAEFLAKLKYYLENPVLLIM